MINKRGAYSTRKPSGKYSIYTGGSAKQYTTYFIIDVLGIITASPLGAQFNQKVVVTFN